MSWNRDRRDLLDPLPPAGLMLDPFLSNTVRDDPCGTSAWRTPPWGTVARIPEGHNLNTDHSSPLAGDELPSNQEQPPKGCRILTLPDPNAAGS
ncbi:unnamed protein product [Lota lota]